MPLDPVSRRLLSQARIGILAINTGSRSSPLVNPAVFELAGDSLWMTTSRHAAKVSLARRDPRAAFLVDAGERAVHVDGNLEVYDLRSIAGSIQAAFDAPSFIRGMAGYSLKNAPFIGGYLFDIASVPRQWWPQNRIVMRLRVRNAVALQLTPIPALRSSRVAGAPADVQSAVGRNPIAYACWADGGMPQLSPCVWVADHSDGLLWLPSGLDRQVRAGTPAALVVEKHHRFRATQMIGVCLRGRIRPDHGAERLIAARYGGDLGDGLAYRLEGARNSWWRGFQVSTTRLAREAPTGQT